MPVDTPGFGARLAEAIDRRGRLIVGIDPHPGLLERWGLADDAHGLREFAARTVDAAAEAEALGIKPQSALFERHGAAGLAVLEQVIAGAREAGLIDIVDAKRGDIGSTMAAYADAYLRDGSPLAGDAVTLSPYLGYGSLRPAIDAAAASGRGVFVLALTSNPEAAALQHAVGADGLSVAAAIGRQAAADNAGASPMGHVGLVVGATIGEGARAAGLDLAAVGGPLLAPGFGAQGAGADEVRHVFGDALDRVVVPSSRAILVQGPDLRSLREAVRSATGQIAF